MPVPRIALPLISDEPLHVSVTRGGAEESCHAVDVALCDADGAVLVGLGDVERRVFPRSAMKPLQAIALAEAWEGLATERRLTLAEFSLICGSHNGQPEHVAAVEGLLAKFGLAADLLSCGRQWSGDRQTMVDQARSLDQPGRIHNNCSGKHAGMLALSTVIGAGPQGYAAITHPVQQKILGVLEAMVGLDLMAYPYGIDGCGAPDISGGGVWACADRPPKTRLAHTRTHVRIARNCRLIPFQEKPSLPEPRFHAVIADDHAIVRAGLRTALETPDLIEVDGIKVVAEAANGLQAIAALRQHRPQLLLLDVQMPHAGGLEVLVEARRWSPDTRIVVLTGVMAVGKISELVSAGVDGLFSKGEDNAELYRQLPNILRGRRHIAESFVRMLQDAPEQTALSARERQTLNLIVAGRSNKEIAATLGISAKTVDRHRTNLMQKLDVHSVAQLIAYALREGLIDPAAEL